RIDCLQDLRCCGLLLQRLAGLGDKASIFHWDPRLRREILQQRDLLVRKGPDFLAIGGNVAEERAVLSERYVHNRANALQVGSSARDGELRVPHIRDMDEALPL